MESPVVLDKPPEFHDYDDRGFPFDDEEGSSGWSELAARHPDIAARLRQRPATWARKRRPSSQDATDGVLNKRLFVPDFGDSFSGFDRFPFDDIPPEFREHFQHPSWNRRFGSREDEPRQPQAQSQASSPPTPLTPQPQQNTAATQTEQIPEEPEPQQQNNLPQYGLRNTVDLGQKSAADPSLVDAEARNQRSMSAPPDSRNLNQNTMNTQGHQEQAQAPPQAEHHSNVRHIPIFVEGRDEPVINKSVDSNAHFGETKQTFQPPQPPPQTHAHPHIDRDQYFADEVPSFHHPPNFSRAFGTPFNKGFRQGPQPFVQQKVYPQGPFAKGASPQRSQSPKPPPPQAEESFVKVPVHHEQAAPRPEPPRPQPKQASPAPQREQTPPQAPPKPQPSANDPITLILSIQTDVLNLMSEVENFAGTKKDKRYLFLDEMLTRNLIKLDNVETDGKENIRQARKEAIKCIQKCIAVLEAKAENNGVIKAKSQDVEMNENNKEGVQDNGEIEMKETKPEETVESQVEAQPPPAEIQEAPKPEETPQEKPEVTPENAQTVDTRPVDQAPELNTVKTESVNDIKESPKKKVVTKNKSASKDNKTAEAAKDSNKKEEAKEKAEVMQVDDKPEAQVMEIDAGASQ